MAGIFDLQDRTFNFALHVRDFLKSVPKTIINIEYVKQLVRSSGSVCANYAEANEALGDKDFLMRLRICKKEAKETIIWLKLLDIDHLHSMLKNRDTLIRESDELKRIFAAMIRNKTANIGS